MRPGWSGVGISIPGQCHQKLQVRLALQVSAHEECHLLKIANPPALTMMEETFEPNN